MQIAPARCGTRRRCLSRESCDSAVGSVQSLVGRVCYHSMPLLCQMPSRAQRKSSEVIVETLICGRTPVTLCHHTCQTQMLDMWQVCPFVLWHHAAKLGRCCPKDFVLPLPAFPLACWPFLSRLVPCMFIVCGMQSIALLDSCRGKKMGIVGYGDIGQVCFIAIVREMLSYQPAYFF